MLVTEMELKDIITSIAAFVGMLLGIYNFFHARSADKVKLQIIPKASSYRGNDHSGREYYLHNKDRYDLNHPENSPDTLSLEIINMSRFTITVDEVGLMPSWSKKKNGTCCANYKRWKAMATQTRIPRVSYSLFRRYATFELK